MDPLLCLDALILWAMYHVSRYSVTQPPSLIDRLTVLQHDNRLGHSAGFDRHDTCSLHRRVNVYKGVIYRVMLARPVQLTRSLYPAAGTVTEDE
jgi:hypothetical protein